MPVIKIRCTRKEANSRLISERDFNVRSDSAGNVVADTSLVCKEWTDPKDPYQLVVFTRKKSVRATAHKIVYEESDLKIVELTTTVGREYIIAVKPGGKK